MRIGVDLGGTKIEALAMDSDGRELQRIRVATPKGDYPGTVDAIAGLVKQLESGAGREATVGVGIPGTLVKHDGQAVGVVKNANSLWLNGKPLEADLSKALSREVRCANDANCFAVSEATDGAAKGYAVVFGVILGTGCGGGMALDGIVGSGPNGLRGEWGHVPLPWQTPVEYPGPACYCGRQGCLETWISGTGFEADFVRRTGTALRGAEIIALAEAGDEEAAAAFARYEDRLARGLAVVVNVMDPDIIVLGGGMSRVKKLYEGRVGELLGEYAFGRGAETPIVCNVHGDSSGVRGAAWLWPQAR